MENVTVLGSGILGLQVAFQTAFNDFKVVIYNPKETSLDSAKSRMGVLSQRYKDEMKCSRRLIQKALDNIVYGSDLAKAVSNADLIIEAVPENLDLKREVFKKMAPLLPEKTIVVTNTSTFLPSDLADSTGRPEKFMALHFANQIWIQNTAEVMASPRTSEENFKIVVEFAEDIGMIPIKLKKEKSGYVLNSLLIPFLSAASDLLMEEIVDFKTIDDTWKIATKSPVGPFEIFDVVGVNTAYNIAKKTNAEFAEYLKTNFLDKGKPSFYQY